jgi:hypothetical protein
VYQHSSISRTRKARYDNHCAAGHAEVLVIVNLSVFDEDKLQGSEVVNGVMSAGAEPVTSLFLGINELTAGVAVSAQVHLREATKVAGGG